MTGSELLAQKGIVKSPIRIEVLNLLLEASIPLLLKEIESKTDKSHDRVTMYRTLKLLEAKGLIHRIPLADNHSAYGINPGNNNHLHFHCTDCNTVYCMPQVPVQPFELPHGFQSHDTNLLVNGICETCGKNNVNQ
jgi:Fur family transcriptional regulator, ferric uptake regulator